MQQSFPHILPTGDQALTIFLGDGIDESINSRVHQLFQYLKKKPINGILDVIPAYTSLTIIYDVWFIEQVQQKPDAYIYVSQILKEAISALDVAPAASYRKIEIPVCYDNSFGIDLEAMSIEKRLTVQEIIDLHADVDYKVYMIGFLPGFAYMGSVDEKIVTPRKQTPRPKIATGSVGIAGWQTGIYPFDSPGGWNIIGQTPLQLFDATKEVPCLLQPGDEVRFIPITLDQFYKIKSLQ